MNRFFRNTVTVVVLTEEPLASKTISIQTIMNECDEGEFVCAAEHISTEEVSPKEMAALLREAGSEPGFFDLDEVL